MTYDPAVKDDSIFDELIEWASQWAQERGIPESQLRSSVSTDELRARVLKYEELRKAPPVYRTVIYPLGSKWAALSTLSRSRTPKPFEMI